MERRRATVTLGPDVRRVAGSFLSIALWCGPLLAQDANKVSNFLRAAMAARSKETVAAAMEMPADKFGYKPSPTDLTFGQLVLHAATTNYQYCSKIGGVAEPEVAAVADMDPKEKIIERLKSSFAFCASAFAKLDDSKKSEILTIGETKTSRAMAILTLTGSWIDHVATESNYLRANGRTPPATGN
jgi:hypothetical protein